MYRQLLIGKLHHAHITGCDKEYMGSIAIDPVLVAAAGMKMGELVHIWAVDHTARIQTYIIPGMAGEVSLNGGAANFFALGDRVVIAAFGLVDDKTEQAPEPHVVILDDKNQIVPAPGR